jgi:hypothetical protein
MSTAAIGADEIRLGEALYRSEGHCLACYELYGVGRRTDALLQAARPIADVLPWLETELRSALGGLRAFTVAVAQIGAQARKGAKARAMKRALRDVSNARAALLDEVIGSAALDRSYTASVGIALLHSVRATYADALRSESLSDYQSAYGTARVAIDLLVGSALGMDAERDLTLLDSAFPSVDPPLGLSREETVDGAIERLTQIASTEGDIISATGDLADSLRKVERLLTDVMLSYERGVPALSARLAASLFVRTFDPIREELSAEDPVRAQQLTELLGVDIRRAINDGASQEKVKALIDRARSVLLGHSMT